MAKRPVHWYEGMFLKPHHFQAADRFVRERVRESEDWHHPHDWGLRSVSLDENAIANFRVVLQSCQARFKDGTTISVPDEVKVGPVELHEALSAASETIVSLAIPTLSETRPNVQVVPSGHDARYFVKTDETVVDENVGANEERIEFRDIQARLLLSNLNPTGFEILPLARIVRSADAEAPPVIDRWFVPPILGLDAWAPLHQEVRSLHEQIGSWITQEADLLIGRKISFDSQVLGDADRVLRLSTLNAAYSALQSVISTRGLHPFDMYRELCRLVGQISIFGEKRRPIEVPGYDHEDIGPIYAKVIKEIRRLVGGAPKVAFEKRYFQLSGPTFAVKLDADWILDTAKLYIGVETVELTDAECDELMRSTNWKLGSGEQVAEIFKAGAKGLTMKPLNRTPSALPSGVVYFEIERDPAYWKDVARTYTLGLRFKLDWGRFRTDKILVMTVPTTQRTVNLQFAVYVVKPG
jgi:type VI secretion system protein ImpJ